MIAKHALKDVLGKHEGFRVELSESQSRADIVLDNPPLNVVRMPQRDDLALTFDVLDQAGDVRVIVLRSEGEHFSSGGDIKGFLAASPEHVSRLAWNVAAPERCCKPVIAAVRGYCFGVGFELTLACDFRVASETAQFALPEMRIGMIPGSGGSARLLKMIGVGRTKDLVMRSRRIPAREALAWGIVTECVADPDLTAATDKLANELCGFSPLAQRTIKSVLNSGLDNGLHAAIELEGQAYGRLRSSDDFREGVESFHQKRSPRFTGT